MISTMLRIVIYRLRLSFWSPLQDGFLPIALKPLGPQAVVFHTVRFVASLSQHAAVTGVLGLGRWASHLLSVVSSQSDDATQSNEL